MNDGTYNFCRYEGKLYIGDGSISEGNGIYYKNIVEANLPKYYQGELIYGNWNNSLYGMGFLIRITIPCTYREIRYSFCSYCQKLESIVFEENSQVESIGKWFAGVTAISSITFPYSLKRVEGTCMFFDCKKLKQIIFWGNCAVSGRIFNNNNPADIFIIIVSTRYPSTTFGEKDVTAVIDLPVIKKYATCKVYPRSKRTKILVNTITNN